MKKRYLAAVVCMALTLSFGGCGPDRNKDDDSSSGKEIEVQENYEIEISESQEGVF